MAEDIVARIARTQEDVRRLKLRRPGGGGPFVVSHTAVVGGSVAQWLYVPPFMWLPAPDQETTIVAFEYRVLSGSITCNLLLNEFAYEVSDLPLTVPTTGGYSTIRPEIYDATDAENFSFAFQLQITPGAG